MLLIHPLSDVSFLELISDAIKTCLIFGCSCSSRAVTYFCHNFLGTNCLESTLFVSVWSSQSNQAVADIYSTLPQSWMELIFEQMNGLFTSVNVCGSKMICAVVKASYGFRLIYLCIHAELWRETVFSWTGLIFFLAAPVRLHYPRQARQAHWLITQRVQHWQVIAHILIKVLKAGLSSRN